MAKKIALNGWTKDKRWVERKKEWRSQRIIVDYAIVDDEDYEKLSERTWYKNSMGYAQSDYPTRITMHKLITGFKMTDHINREKLDNRRENLRQCTHKTNVANTENRSGKYKGVTFCKQTNKWRASKRVGKKSKHLGRYNTPEQAAHAYNLFVINLPTAEYEYLNEISIYDEVN